MAEFNDAQAADPPLLRRYSTLRCVNTKRFTYPSIRVFFKRHEQESQLPVDPAPLPLLVFIHGLGGSASQFGQLLTRLTNCASCLAVDLPGCGRSEFAPTAWEAYSQDALAELLEEIITQHLQPEQGVVFIGHSMGCSLAALLASRHAADTGTSVSFSLSGLVAICPSAGFRERRKVTILKALLWIPTPLFDMWRAWDGRAGPESPSVLRFVGPEAEDDLKLMQATYNKQSRTAVWRRMAWGCLPDFVADKPVGGLSSKEVWGTLSVPVCLISGGSDQITPPGEAKTIMGFLKPIPTLSQAGSSSVAEQNMPPSATTLPSAAELQPSNTEFQQPKAHGLGIGTSTLDDAAFSNSSQPGLAPERREDGDETPTTPGTTSAKVDIPPLRQHPLKSVEAHIVPAPANHTLPYAPFTVGVVSGLISQFLSRRVTGRLDRGWQLRFLSREGKWDVKNLEKWTRVVPVSESIVGIFRAMKTFRQMDDVHSPQSFVENWAHIVKDVIDISHDNPVYDPRDLEVGGISYHKFSTVSKIPPTDLEVDAFVALVDKIRAKRYDESAIGVHCHYGFNRTGYFIVCYLVDRCEFSLSEAIATFAKARPDGIRHGHFLDALSLRYINVQGNIAEA